MAKYGANAAQTLSPNSPAIFTETIIPSRTGLVFHADGTGVFRLASPFRILGKSYGGCGCNRRMLYADYPVSVSGNVAIPTGGTAGEIDLAFMVDGVTDPTTIIRLTPTEIGSFWHFSEDSIVSVPAICGCETLSFVCITDQNVTIENLSLEIPNVAIR